MCFGKTDLRQPTKEVNSGRGGDWTVLNRHSRGHLTGRNFSIGRALSQRGWIQTFRGQACVRQCWREEEKHGHS